MHQETRHDSEVWLVRLLPCAGSKRAAPGLEYGSVAAEVSGELAVFDQQMLRGELKHHKVQQFGGVKLVAGITRSQQLSALQQLLMPRRMRGAPRKLRTRQDGLFVLHVLCREGHKGVDLRSDVVLGGTTQHGVDQGIGDVKQLAVLGVDGAVAQGIDLTPDQAQQFGALG